MDRLSPRAPLAALAALAVVAASPSPAQDESEAAPADPEPARESGVITLDDVFVTAVGRPEPLSTVASTVQTIDAEEIQNAHSSTVTGALQERGVAFFSEWTPGQTSITMRGARGDGQGRDFRGQVLVLMNGRRAGTTNLSKLSPDQVHRIEIVRGAASAAFGNQALGGVINLITRDSRSVEGGTASIEAGSSAKSSITASAPRSCGGIGLYP